MNDDQRQTSILALFAREPRRFREERRPDILAGVITPGMTPEEAMLAGGASTYKVKPDRSRWSADSDPYDVMRAQSSEPDDSEITLIFQNRSQSRTGEFWKFHVTFERGVAVEIRNLLQ